MITVFAKAPRRVPPQTAFERIAATLVPKLRKRFLAAAQALQASFDLTDLAEAVAGRNLRGIEVAFDARQFDKTLFDSVQVVNAAFAKGGTAAATMLPPGSVAVSFDLTNPQAVFWANRNAARLVTQVTQQTRKAVRQAIVQAVSDGIGPHVAALEIRNLIGLTDRQAGAVQNYRKQLTAAKMAPKRVADLTARYSKRLLKQRATLIARTELLRAASAGQAQLWRQGIDRGDIDTNTTLRKWVATPGERTCDICRPMWGELTPVDLPWILKSDGREAWIPQDSHPQCRCTQRLVFGVNKFALAQQPGLSPVLKDWCQGAGGANRCAPSADLDPVTTQAIADVFGNGPHAAKALRAHADAVARTLGPDYVVKFKGVPVGGAGDMPELRMTISSTRDADVGYGQVRAGSFVQRTFLRQDDGTVVAHHSYMLLAADQQGKGSAKRIMADALDAYDTLGVRRVELSAGDKVGGYAWAKMGFTAANPREFAEKVQFEIDAKGGAHRAALTALVRANRNNKHLPALLADAPGGKQTMLGKWEDGGWDAELDLEDTVAMARVRRYVGGK